MRKTRSTVPKIVFITAFGIGSTMIISAVFAQDCPELVGRWPYGPSYAVAVSGDSAYIGSGTVLQIASVSVPGTPQLLGEVVLPDIVRRVTVSGGYAFVALDAGGLRVIDVGNPASPTEIGFVDTPGKARDVAVSGGYAYVADQFSLQVIDVSTPTSPIQVGFFATAGNAFGVAVSGDYAFVAEQGEGLRVIDVSNPASPTEIGFCDTPGYLNRVTVSGDTAYVAGGSSGGLRMIDVSNPASPTEIGFYDTPGTARAVAVSGSYAYVADYGAGLQVVDVGNPASPTEIGFFDTPGYATDIALWGGNAFIADEYQGVRVIDIGAPTAPAEIGFFATHGWSYRVAVSGNYAFVADFGGSLRVIDVSNAASPTEIGFYTTPGYPYGVAVSGGHVYVADFGQGLRVIDVSNPALPTEIGFYDTPGNAMGVAVSDGLAFVADQGEGLRVIDVSNPAAPTEIGFCETPGNALGVAVSGDYAFVAAANSGLRIIDVSTPAAPTEIGFYDTAGSAQGVALSGGHAFVVDQGEGLRVIDVSDPASPSEVGFFETPGNAWVVAVSDNYAYLANGIEGLRVIDVSNPASPSEVGFYDTPGYAYGVAVSGDFVYVADNDAGMEVFLVCDASSPGVSNRIYIPASGTGPGSGDSLWSTDAVLNHVGDSQLTYEVHYLAQDQDNSQPMTAGPFVLDPGVSVLFSDVLRKLFGVDSGSGALRFEIVGDSTGLLMSRTKNTDADGATFGQGIPPVLEDQLIPANTTVRLVQLTQNSDLRTNIGFMNGSDRRIEIEVDFFSGDGTNLGTDTAFLEPYSYTQWNRAFNRVGKTTVRNGYVDIQTVSDGALFDTYASVVDEVKGDPTYISRQIVGGDTPTQIYIPASGTGAGAGSSLWATDVVLNNSGASVVTYDVHFLAKGRDNTDPPTAGPFNLNPGVSVVYSDVLGELFDVDSGSGALRFELAEAGPVILMSRTKNTDSDGATFGQGIPAVPEDQLVPAKTKVRLIQLAENDSLRTNIGFMNGSGIGISIEVEFFAGDGLSLGSDSIFLKPYSYNQWNRAFSRVGITDVDNGYVDVWTKTPGGRFFTYGSVVDELKGDPTYISPQSVR